MDLFRVNRKRPGLSGRMRLLPTANLNNRRCPPRLEGGAGCLGILRTSDHAVFPERGIGGRSIETYNFARP